MHLFISNYHTNIMRYIWIVLLSFLSCQLPSQTRVIRGKLFGERSRYFNLTNNYCTVDGFGSKKTIRIDSIENNIIRFTSDLHRYWLSTEGSKTYLNISWSRCTFCKPYRFQVSKIQKFKLK